VSSYHGWTHAPKEQGGTDPIPSVAAEFPWARRSKGFDASNQIIGTGTVTAVTFNHDYNMGAGESGEGYFDVLSDSIEILQDGVYLISGGVIWFESSTFDCGVGYYDAVANDEHMFIGANITGSNGVAHSFTHMHRYTAGSVFITLNVVQTSGSTRNVDAAYLEVMRIGSWTGTDFTAMDPFQ
jgi:hypothetical protein